MKRGLQPAMIRAGVSVGGRAIIPACTRCAISTTSWCINRPADGGLGLPIKVVQERLGHASIMLTSDRYGHLFARGDDADEMAAAERSLLGSAAT